MNLLTGLRCRLVALPCLPPPPPPLPPDSARNKCSPSKIYEWRAPRLVLIRLQEFPYALEQLGLDRGRHGGPSRGVISCRGLVVIFSNPLFLMTSLQYALSSSRHPHSSSLARSSTFSRSFSPVSTSFWWMVVRTCSSLRRRSTAVSVLDIATVNSPTAYFQRPELQKERPNLVYSR